MKKLILPLLVSLLLFSCQKDLLEDLEPTLPQEEMIFKIEESSVVDGQTIFFNIDSEVKHTLIIFDTERKSVVSKQSFTPVVGLNDFQIFTKALPKKKLQLQLFKLSDKVKTTFIQIY